MNSPKIELYFFYMNTRTNYKKQFMMIKMGMREIERENGNIIHRFTCNNLSQTKPQHTHNTKETYKMQKRIMIFVYSVQW